MHALTLSQCGYVVDRLKGRPIVLQLLTLSSCFTLACYFWLALPPAWTKTAIPSVALFGIGHGFSPCMSMWLSFSPQVARDADFVAVLLVVIVPQIVPLKFVPTALGAHKSVSMYIKDFKFELTFRTLARTNWVNHISDLCRLATGCQEKIIRGWAKSTL
jgi:hypothetical protein